MPRGATKRPRKGTRRAQLGQIRRGGNGEVEMIEFNEYKPSPLAPTILVNKVGGIYRVTNSILKCTFALASFGPGGIPECIERVNLLWEVHDWLEGGEAFRWAMREFAGGTFRDAIPDDGGGRRPRTQ